MSDKGLGFRVLSLRFGAGDSGLIGLGAGSSVQSLGLKAQGLPVQVDLNPKP